MELLPNGSAGESSEIVPYGGSPILLEKDRHGYAAPDDAAEEGGGSINVGQLARRYWLLFLLFLILGAAGGFASVVLSSPSYQARLLLEVQSGGSALLRNGGGGGSDSGDGSEVGIQTQISILRSFSFRQRGAERMNQEVPLAPTGKDIFSRLRQRLHPAIQDPLENAKQGLSSALESFNATSVIRTRLIELTCESSSPDVAAQYLNAMASEFVDDSTRSRMKTAQATSEWLAQSIEDTKAKMQEAEEHLRDFVQASGNIFAGQDATLDDTKLASLKGDLAKSQADAILKRTRFELTLKYPPEALGEVLDDPVLRGYQQKINALKEQKAALEVKYTPKHQKVREVDAQLGSVQKDYENEIHSVVSRIKNDYEAASRQQKLLNDTYNSQAQRVGALAAKASQYNALKREAETLHQVYQSLLMQQSETGLNSSVPVTPIRIVEAATPPAFPYKPKPILNISFGGLLGAVLAVGLVLLRERADHSIRVPGVSRRLFNVPELGVIPNLSSGQAWRAIGGPKSLALNGHADEAAAALMNWQSGPSFITESFRGTLTSILRNQANGKAQKIILITSPGPSEGKTTVIQNLGIALAETGRRVLLVDADFRRPHLHRKFGLPNEWGMINLLTEDTSINDYQAAELGVPTGVKGLSLLANGPVTEPAIISRALYSPRLREIFKILVRHYDMVLVDAPPILNVADARIIAPIMDALILVLRSGVTDRASAVEAYQRIQEDGLTLLGTVLTDYDIASQRKRQYYYDYGDPSRA